MLAKAFEPNYDVEILHDFPGIHDENLVFFPDDERGIGRDGIMLKVTLAESHSWTGLFAFGDFPLSGIFTCPNSSQLCVVSRGKSYLVDVATAKIAFSLRVYPVIACVQLEERGLILLHDWWEVTALGVDGILWRSNTGASDDMTIEKCDSEYLYAAAFVDGQRDQKLRIRLHDGATKFLR